jgi:hypothetical protein
MKNNNAALKISNTIKTLDISSLSDNLLHYTYNTRYLLSLIKKNVPKDDPHFISSYNGFRGELFENVTYELLLQYCLKNNYVSSFILKGPHQNYIDKENQKFGLMMDRKQQIVYKAGYKDVSEYDAMFFTKDAVYFVEATIVVSTMGLRKRLRKKYALLSLLFPNLEVKALIILSEGATGVHKFPEFATVWVTNTLDPNVILDKISMGNEYKKDKISKYTSEKLIQTHNVKVEHFKYFDTLAWIFRKTLFKDTKMINEKFFRSEKVNRYIEIFSKVYIGVISFETLKELTGSLDFTTVNHVHVTIDKKDDGSFYVVFYTRVSKKRLTKIEILNDGIKLSDKDPKGFTVAEVKFIDYIVKQQNEISLKQLKNIIKRVLSWK